MSPSSIWQSRSPVSPLKWNWLTVFDLLALLLSAYGWTPTPPEPATNRMLGAIPRDPDERRKNARREEQEALPVLRELVERIDALRTMPLKRPAEYEREWRAIIDRWNNAIRESSWLEMTPLCETCGKPVQRKVPWFGPDTDGPQTSFTCSERCRAAHRQRKHRESAKLRDPEPPTMRQRAARGAAKKPSRKRTPL